MASEKKPKDAAVPVVANGAVLSKEQQAVLEQITGGNWKKFGRVAMAAMGALPWVGSVISAAATLSAENEQGETNHLLQVVGPDPPSHSGQTPHQAR